MTVYISGDTRGYPQPTLCALKCIYLKKEEGRCLKGKRTNFPCGGGWGGTKIRKQCRDYEVKEPT
jgi:hypothetical protein